MSVERFPGSKMDSHHFITELVALWHKSSHTHMIAPYTSFFVELRVIMYAQRNAFSLLESC